MSRAYYNEFDKATAAWLRELIHMGLIADGDVDERSIEDVYPSDLRGYTQCHFFAGIGGWSYALRLAGWPDDRPVWSGSCPCQPFSSAGKGTAFDDERHLWPAFQHLIKECSPAIVVGEQVASKDANPWIDLVQDDMEGMGYEFAAVPFPSASVGAPHIRDRLYWVGIDQSRAAGAMGIASISGLEGLGGGHQAKSGRNGAVRSVAEAGELGGMADATMRRCKSEPNERSSRIFGKALQQGRGWEQSSDMGTTPFELANADQQQRDGTGYGWSAGRGEFANNGAIVGLADASNGSEQRGVTRPTIGGLPQGAGEDVTVRPGPTNGFWRDSDWLFCRDGKWRPVKPGAFPLVNGLPRGVVPSSRIGMEIDADKTPEARVMRLRGYGNAINAVQAALFVEIVAEILKCPA